MNTSADTADSASDDEYEETYVMVELSGIVDTDYFSRPDPPNCRVWGLDSDQPVLQLDRYFFVGGFDDVVGTALLFDEVVEESADKRNETAEDSTTKITNDIFTTFNNDAYQKSANVFNMTTSHLEHEGTPSAKTQKKKMSLFGHSFKKLSMQRAFLNKKSEDSAADLGETADEEVQDEESLLNQNMSQGLSTNLS